MKMNIVEGPAKITQLIKDCITQEMVKGGILKEVNEFVPSYRLDGEIEEPFIGLFEQETTPIVNGTLSHKLELRTPFEFVCVVYDDEDIEQSEIKGKQLACKVAAAIAKNFLRKDSDGNSISISRLNLEAIYPVGTVEVVDKSEEAVATSVRISIDYYVDWLICQKNQL